MEELAPAKVNLVLRVLRRREDGFHEIETLMAPISLCDSLQVEPADVFQFQSNDPTLPQGEDNLVVRAARSFFSATRRKPALRITLQKRIPYGAGLGGGSSDAAATLRLLNRYCETSLTLTELGALAVNLGSDVPFFLTPHPAICRGRGEIVEATILPQQFHLLLIKPQFGVPTIWAYSRWARARQIPNGAYRPQKIGQQIFVNDLERPVFEKFVFLAELKSWLVQTGKIKIALMAGSGSTIFAVLSSPTDAVSLIERARAELDPHLWTAVCETL